MFSRRLTPLIDVQIERAVSTACSSVRCGEVLEEALRVLEHRLAELQEALDVPLLDVFFGSVDEDREVEVVADELLAAVADLQHVQPFEDQDVGLVHGHPAAFDDVVHDVAVDRRVDLGDAALQLAEEHQQSPRVVALGEPLAVHDVALFEHRVRMEEAVRRHQIDLRMVRPAGRATPAGSWRTCSCRPPHCRPPRSRTAPSAPSSRGTSPTPDAGPAWS